MGNYYEIKKYHGYSSKRTFSVKYKIKELLIDKQKTADWLITTSMHTYTI